MIPAQISEMSFSLKEKLEQVEWREFICGWGAAFVNIAVTYPIYKTIFRQMLDGISTYSAMQQIHKEGIYFLYRGMMPPLAQKTLSLSIMFGVYEEVKRPLVNSGTVNIYTAKTIAAMTAGTFEAILMPFERIQTLLATATFHEQFRNTYHAFRYVGMTYGIAEYYRGLVPILLRNGPSNVVFFIAREEVHSYLPANPSWLQLNVHEFCSGAVIGVITSSIFYPLNVLKINMQSHLGGPFENMFKVLRQIYIERGSKLRNIYHGVEANCFRAFLSWGVMNAAYESLRKLLY